MTTRWRRAMWHVGVAALAMALTSACSADNTSEKATGRKAAAWSRADMRPQTGQIFLVTGGTSGIGFETARSLAAAGAQVVIASRDPASRGDEVTARILLETPGAHVRYESFDLADLSSVRALAERMKATLPRLDGLINNAGIMEPPERGMSVDGFEMQFAVNYLGHFALTAELLPLLRKAAAPRVVTLSSIAAGRGAIQFQDLQFTAHYDAAAAYGQSKLACLMFARELQRRSEAGGWGIRSIAVHPGLARTNLQSNHGLLLRSLRIAFQTAEQGSLSTLYAATDPAAQGGAYYGPTGFMEARGALGLAEVPAAATDAQAASRLWTISETLSGSRFP